MTPPEPTDDQLARWLHAARTEPVPPELHARLERVFADHVAAAEPVPPGRGLAARVRAALVFDSLLEAGPAGARGAAARQERQLVLAAPGLEIALDVGAARGGRVPARAQLLPLDDGSAADVRVRVWSSRGLDRRARTDSAGGVDLGELPVAVCVLEVDAVAHRWPVVDADLDLRTDTRR